MGRHKLSDEDKTKYQRIAIMPETYEVIKLGSTEDKMLIKDWVDKKVKE